MRAILKRKDILFPEFSYRIVGSAFDVYNELGAGYYENKYQKALAISFEASGLKFSQQVYYPASYKGIVIGKKFFDFLVEDSIIVEIKRGNRFSKSHIDQVLNYLKSSSLKLAILINFGSLGVNFRRIINFN